MLKSDFARLCADCHTTESSSIAKSVHQTVPCGTCHQLHDSADVHLLKTAQPQLCFQCHSTSMFDGKTPIANRSWNSPHPVSGAWDPVANAPLTCTSTCHNPHGSPYFKTLRVAYNSDGMGSDYLCITCHTEVGISY